MEPFDQLTTLWQTQVTPPAASSATAIMEKAMAKMRSLKAGYRITLLILGITGAVLLVLLVLASGKMLVTGLSLMAGALLARMVLEQLSLKKLSKLPGDQSLETCRQAMTRYYHWRLRKVTIYTALLYLIYCAGFVLLLPVFRQALPPAIFTLVWVSGAIILTGYAAFIAYHLRKELTILHQITHLLDDNP